MAARRPWADVSNETDSLLCLWVEPWAPDHWMLLTGRNGRNCFHSASVRSPRPMPGQRAVLPKVTRSTGQALAVAPALADGFAARVLAHPGMPGADREYWNGVLQACGRSSAGLRRDGVGSCDLHLRHGPSPIALDTTVAGTCGKAGRSQTVGCIY
jgi:hypothetical protein